MHPLRIIRIVFVMIATTQCSDALNRQVEVHGHRGARSKFPENSIPGFIYATEIGVTAMELDVVVTRFGDVIVSHEPWFNEEICTLPNGQRIPSGVCLSFFEMPIDEIQSYDCGSLRHPRFHLQQLQASIKPTLREVVQAAEHVSRPLGCSPVEFNIEIKHDPALIGSYFPTESWAVQKVLHEIEELGIANRSIIQSFSAEVMELVHAAKVNELRTAFLMEEDVDFKTAMSRISFVPDIYSPTHIYLTQDAIDQAHEARVKVVPWTVNDAAQMRSLVEWGVDGLITDDPQLFLDVLKEAHLQPLTR